MTNRPRTSAHRYTSNVIPPLTMMIDALSLLLPLPLAAVTYRVLTGASFAADLHLAAAVIAAVAFFLIRQGHGAYSRPLEQLQKIELVVVADYAVAALLASAVIWQVGQVALFSRGLTLVYVGYCLGFMIITRVLLHTMLLRLARSGQIGQRVVLYGADSEMVARTCELLRLQFLPQLTLVGVSDDRLRKPSLGELPYVGGLDELVALARANEVDQVFITLKDINRTRLNEILEALSAVLVDVSLIPREVVDLAPDYRLSFLGEVPVLALWRRPIRDINRLLKRGEDLGVAVAALIVFAPLILLTAIAIKATSRGPILFVQQRFGFNNREISVYKFRSMYADQGDPTGAARTTKHDPRVTPVGRVIRKLSIDELPQIWNVLRGEMSIVGPRPHAIDMKVGDLYYLDAVCGYSGRHRVKPGITGLAQVRGLRGEIQTIERAKRRVELDLYYINNWSLLLDFRIMLETVVGLVFDKNAY